MNKTPTDGERWTMERAADFLEWYASFIREHVMSVDIEMHPYLPELEYVAGQVRDWFKPAASPMNKTKHITQEGWQPIETAPKDGTRVLTYRAEFRESMAVAWFNDTGCGEPCWVPVNGAAWPDPTHWMPIPPPPTQEGGGMNENGTDGVPGPDGSKR